MTTNVADFPLEHKFETSTSAKTDRINAALVASRGTSPARYRITAWPTRAASRRRSGIGEFRDLSTETFGKELKDDALKIVPKGEGVAFALGTSSGGGSTDEECVARHGLTLDLDDRPVWSDGTQGWEPVSEALRAADISHIVQVRAGKCHLHIPFAAPWTIDVSDKSFYKEITSFLVRKFGELAGVTFDEHEAARMLGLVYAYTRRTEGDTVTTISHDGVGLDLDLLVDYFADELRPEGPAEPVKPPASPDGTRPYERVETATTFSGPSYAPTLERVRRAQAYLATVPPAIEGQSGDSRTLKACMVAARDFDLDDEAALEALRPWNARSLPPWDEAELLKKIENARRYGSGDIGNKCAREENRPPAAQKTAETSAATPANTKEPARWTNRHGDPNLGPLVLFVPAKEKEVGATLGNDGKYWRQIQPTTAMLTRKVRKLKDYTNVIVVRQEGAGNRIFEVLADRIVRATDEDGLRNALTRSCRDMMGGMEPEPKTITTAVQLLCDRARPEIEMKTVRWQGETCYALHEIPNPKEGDWSAHKEIIDRFSCPDTAMSWVWTLFMDERETGRESLYLFGDGNDGKSYWAEALLRFLGPAATTSQILKGDNRFELAPVLDKRLAYFGDTRNPKPIHPKVMREVIAGAYLPFERKGKDVQIGYFHPRCLFTSNIHFKIDVNDRAEYTRIRKILVAPLPNNTGDREWPKKLLAQMPALLWVCREAYQRFATPGEDLPITQACRDALAGGSDAINEEFDFLDAHLEFRGNDSDFIKAKRLVELFKLAGHRDFSKTNAYAWIRSRGATKGVKKIRNVSVAVWSGVREIQEGLYADVGSAASTVHETVATN